MRAGDQVCGRFLRSRARKPACRHIHTHCTAAHLLALCTPPPSLGSAAASPTRRQPPPSRRRGGLARAAAVCQVAWQPPSAARKRPRDDSAQPPPRAPPPLRAADPPLEQPPGCLGGEPDQSRVPRVGMLALDLTSACRFVALQWLDLGCRCFLWLDEDGRPGFRTDRRLCFGGGYGPNRFERIATLVAASISRRLAAVDAARPYPVDMQPWTAARREAQRRGELEAGEANRSPRAIQVYLDDLNAVGSLDSVPHPLGVAPLEYDAAATIALGLRPVEEGCRLLAHAAIAVDEVGRFELEVAVPETLAGSSIISLGLQPDVAEWSITAPEAERIILIEHSRAFEAQVAARGRIRRRDAGRWAGRLCNVAQLLPELSALLRGGYTVATARERGGRRRLLDSVSLRADSRVGRDFADSSRGRAGGLGRERGRAAGGGGDFPRLERPPGSSPSSAARAATCATPASVALPSSAAGRAWSTSSARCGVRARPPRSPRRSASRTCARAGPASRGRLGSSTLRGPPPRRRWRRRASGAPSRR